MDTVRRWMSTPSVVAPTTTLLPEARRLLRERRIRRVPVVDKQGQLVGIVTEGDINRISDSEQTDVRDYNLYHRIADLPIGDVMTSPVITVAADTPIMEAAQLMIDHRIGGIPVLDDNQLVGIITESDLFRLIIAQQKETASDSKDTQA